MRIPYARQSINNKDLEEVNSVLSSPFIARGPTTEIFEKKLIKYTGAKFACALSSATAGLHIACLSLGLNKGDFLWTSPITFVASANCGKYCGANVDFVDIDLETGLISVKSLSTKLKAARKTKSLPKILVVTHLAGQPCDMKEIYLLSKKYNFKIIEDASHAIGAKYKKNKIGNCRYSDIAVFSFHPVKIITTGEGGAVLTNSSALIKKLKILRGHGITKNKKDYVYKNKQPWYYEQHILGYNYFITDFQSALGISQLKRVEKFINKRKKIFNWYEKKLNFDGYKSLVQKKDRNSSLHLYIIKFNEGLKLRNEVYNYFKSINIDTNVHYIPIYKMPFYKNTCKYPNSDKYYDQCLSLPMYYELNYKTVNKICNLLNKKIRLLNKNLA
tara:strand:- start:3230 stop:4393 length:1164 start_codon:yes stop_codon:yes gene_type:complete